jgi:hypothetical protein
MPARLACSPQQAGFWGKDNHGSFGENQKH